MAECLGGITALKNQFPFLMEYLEVFYFDIFEIFET